MRGEEQQLAAAAEGIVVQELRIKATELFIREEWQESVQAYTRVIHLCQQHISKAHQNGSGPDPSPDADQLTKLQKALCVALSNRAEAKFRMRHLDDALKDCENALEMDGTHFKSLLCKGKILLSLNRYSMALDCFKTVLLDSQDSGNLETINGYVEKCKKLEFQSKTGAFDLSDWVLSRFRGKPPELSEYYGAVQVQRSELSGRGLFATKNIDAGTLVLVTKAIATERGILSGEDSNDNARLVMWKNLVEKVVESATKCQRIHCQINTLSSGEKEDMLEVPEISLFRPEAAGDFKLKEKPVMAKILSILDVNSLVEDSVSAKALGKNSGYYGVGLWILASFINHSCNPNARRLHVGDYVLVHASRDVKAGEEITSAYFDVLSPLDKRKEMSKTWGFNCNCKRCKFEEELCSKQEIKEMELGLERGIDVGGIIFRLEENIRRCMVRGKDKGYLRASFWTAYGEAYGSDKWLKRWGRRIPAMDVVVDSVADTVGSDERLLKVLMEGLKRNGSAMVEMERAMRLGKGMYGKVVKKQAMRSLLELGNHETKY